MQKVSKNHSWASRSTSSPVFAEREVDNCLGNREEEPRLSARGVNVEPSLTLTSLLTSGHINCEQVKSHYCCSSSHTYQSSHISGLPDPGLSMVPQHTSHILVTNHQRCLLPHCLWCLSSRYLRCYIFAIFRCREARDPSFISIGQSGLLFILYCTQDKLCTLFFKPIFIRKNVAAKELEMKGWFPIWVFTKSDPPIPPLGPFSIPDCFWTPKKTPNNW